MNKYDLTKLKNKISSRDREEIKESATSRFSQADQVLNNDKEDTSHVNSIQQPRSTATKQVVRKNFSLPIKECPLIDIIKDKALDRKVVLSDSEVLRLGLLVLSELSADDIRLLASGLEKMRMGKPKKCYPSGK